MNAKILSDFLKTSKDLEIIALATAIDELREKTINQLKIPESNESGTYWKKHKFIASVDTDWDFYVKDQDSGDVSNNVVLEWVGDSREDVINAARQYLSDINNYSGSEKNIKYFIESYVDVGLTEITDSDQVQWCTGGNWEVEFAYELPDTSPLDVADYKPHSYIFGVHIDLLTSDEIAELGL